MKDSKISEIESANFLEYISLEEYNFLTSILRLEKEFALFTEIDLIYKEYIKIIKSLKIKPNHESVIWSLLYFVHFNFYFSIACLMRGYCVEAFGSVRRAIDAGLSAYLIIEDNSSVTDYINSEKRFVYIKNTLQKERDRDSFKFPLAEGLIELHENCSAYASHADIKSFIHRIVIEKDKLGFNYFSIPEDENDFKLYFIVCLMSYYYLFRIFKVFIDLKLNKIVLPHLEKKYLDLESQLIELRKKFYQASKQT